MGHYEGMQVEDAVLRATRWMMMSCKSTRVVLKSILSHEECCIQFVIFGAGGLSGTEVETFKRWLKRHLGWRGWSQSHCEMAGWLRVRIN